MARITLAHGNGGRYMRQLIEEVFATHLTNDLLDTNNDAAALPALSGELVMTTDSFTVQPLEFPGGDIGSLAVHGTVNDLAVSGATPKFMSLSVIIEEGLELTTLERIINSLAQAALTAKVKITCGDTKVVPRGEAGGLYINTTGIGVRNGQRAPGLERIRHGDKILVSGTVGDHGTAIMLAREQFGLQGDIQSDSASVLPLCQSIGSLSGLRFMRDPTRGGLATVLHEIHRATSLGIRIHEAQIPVRETVTSVCDILGYDPFYLACEGRVVAVVRPGRAEETLHLWQSLPEGREARIIGQVEKDSNRVVLTTELGGERFIEELEDDPLPRIC